MAAPPGTKGDPAGIRKLLMCLRVWAMLSASEISREQGLRDAAGGKLGLGRFRGFVHESRHFNLRILRSLGCI